MHFCTHDHKHLILKARPRRKVSNTYKRSEALSKQMARAVQVNFVKGIKKFKKKISPEKVFQAWKTGSYGHILETMPWQDLPDDLSDMNTPLAISSYKAGVISLEAMPPPVKAGLRWDIKNPAISQFVHKRTAMLIHQNIMQDATSVIQQAVQRSFTEALRPDQVARQIKGSVGLLPRHAAAVENYGRSLEKQGFAPDRVEKLTGAYQERLLNYRGMMIGRTETRFATNHGQLTVWKEAANQDLIDRNTAKKSWVTDGAPCEICEPMDGIEVPIDGLWTLNTGDMVEIPTESHPNCMCGMELVYDFDESEE